VTPVCDECGALVSDEQKHADWHKTVVVAGLAPGEPPAPLPEPDPIPELDTLDTDTPEEN
jgi:hypothetical protein